MLVAELLSQIPRSTKREVQDAYARFGKEARNAVTTAIRLPLSWTQKEDGAAWLCSCPVHVDEIGYPELVGRIEIAPKFELAARVQVWLASLRGFHQRAAEMLELASTLKPYLPALINLPAFVNNVRDADLAVQSLTELSNVEEFDLARIILDPPPVVLDTDLGTIRETETRS